MTVSAATIDAYLRTGRTPRQIADWFGIPIEQVNSRSEIMARRKAEKARLTAERVREHAARRKERESVCGIDQWLTMDIRYEDDPRSPPFDYSAAIRNTLRINARRPQSSSYGGGVSSVYESERGFDFHASRREAA